MVLMVVRVGEGRGSEVRGWPVADELVCVEWVACRLLLVLVLGIPAVCRMVSSCVESVVRLLYLYCCRRRRPSPSSVDCEPLE